MSERETVVVPHEEIQKQREFIDQVRAIHNIEYQQGEKQKRYSIHNFGCQMNENDSEKLAGMLMEMGYSETDKTEESDLILFNTCCVRENAELKVYGHLGALKELKEKNPSLIIAVCGCMMQQKEVVEHIRQKFRQVDLVFGTHNLYKFPELVYSVMQTSKRIIDIWESAGFIVEDMPIARNDDIKASVTVMYGCNNFCSYCIVPYVRGRERSRSLKDIVAEVEKLGQQGYKEITLLGQNVNSYGKDFEQPVSFAELLTALDKVDGIERIRFLTSHPKDLSDVLIEAIRDCKKVCEHLHLPIQSGSTRILHEMNRKYTKEQYIDLANRIKVQVPNISLSTDIIVGYPGETEEDFLETLDLMESVRFDMAYTFLYSKRTGTPAAKHQEQVSEVTMKERFARLVKVQNRIIKEINDRLLGQVLEVLVEGLSKNSGDMYTGRTRKNKIVNFKGNMELVGKLVQVKIEKVQTWSLEGTVV